MKELVKVPVTWVKAKYITHKPTGRYRSNHNDSHKKTKKLGGNPQKLTKPTSIRVLIIDGSTGKRRWGWMNGQS